MSNDFYRLSILPHVPIVIKICRAYTNSQEDFEDYLDASNPGMKSFLKLVATRGEDIPDGWQEARRQEFTDRVVEDHVQVWRALKNLTFGEARKVVMAVKGEDGFKT